MAGHYLTLASQLRADIQTVLSGCDVHFGRRKRLVESLPAATVISRRALRLGGREDAVRAPMEVFTFDVMFRVAEPSYEPDLGLESYCMELAEQISDLIMPISTVAMPTPSPYAGVCSMINVDSLEYVPTDNEDAYLSWRMQVTAYAVVKR